MCNHTIAAKGRVQVSQGRYRCKLARQALVTLRTLPTTPALLDALSVLGTLDMQ